MNTRWIRWTAVALVVGLGVTALSNVAEARHRRHRRDRGCDSYSSTSWNNCCNSGCNSSYAPSSCCQPMGQQTQWQPGQAPPPAPTYSGQEYGTGYGAAGPGALLRPPPRRRPLQRRRAWISPPRNNPRVSVPARGAPGGAAGRALSALIAATVERHSRCPAGPWGARNFESGASGSCGTRDRYEPQQQRPGHVRMS